MADPPVYKFCLTFLYLTRIESRLHTTYEDLEELVRFKRSDDISSEEAKYSYICMSIHFTYVCMSIQ